LTGPTSAALLRADYANACSDKPVNGVEFGLLGMILVQGGAVWISHMIFKFVFRLQTMPVAEISNNSFQPVRNDAGFSKIMTWKAAA